MKPSLKLNRNTTVQIFFCVLSVVASFLFIQKKSQVAIVRAAKLVSSLRGDPVNQSDGQNRTIASTPVIAGPARRDYNLTIPAGETFYLDQSIEFESIEIYGQLICLDNPTGPIEIKAKSIEVYGLFQCGTEQNPYRSQLTISLKHNAAIDPKNNHNYRGMMVYDGGVLRLVGDSKKAGYLKLDQTAHTGDQSIVLNQSVESPAPGYFARIFAQASRWQVGDKIAIAPTSFEPNEAEQFTIISIQENVIGLNQPLQHQHWGKVQTIPLTRPPAHKSARIAVPVVPTVKLDQRAEVVNLTRNILIRADETGGAISEADASGAELGGHVMVMEGGAAYINSVEFYKMGHAGIMGRYPFHWHVVGNVQGQYIKNSSIHKSFQRCITVHRTDFALVDRNTCFDIKGHAFFLEDGTEKNNTITGNIGFGIKYPYRSKRLLSSDYTATGTSPMGENQGRFPNTSVFWISHPYNYVKNNVSAGSVGTGFWMAFHNEVQDTDGTLLHPRNSPTLYFGQNVAHSSLVGFTWDGGPNGGLVTNPNNPSDHSNEGTYYEPPVSPTFEKLVAYKNSYTGIYVKGVSGEFKNALTADNGWHFWVAGNQIFRNSIIVGRSENFGPHEQALLDTNLGRSYINIAHIRAQQAGVVFYDGPFEMDGLRFIDFPTQQQLRTSDGRDITATAIGIAGGTEAFMNFSRRISFLPEPFYKISVGDYDNSSLLRDVDGSISGRPGGAVLVGKRSLGISASSGCQTNIPQLQNMAVCPPDYQEGSFNIFAGDYVTNIYGNQINYGIWGQPFVARRSDGEVTNPISQWPGALLYGPPWNANGTKFGIANTITQDFQLLLLRHHPTIWLNSESMTPLVPVTELVAHGKNCQLVNDNNAGTPALIKNSINELRAATQSSYYSSGDKLFVRLLPSRPIFNVWGPGIAKGYSSDHFMVECAGNVDPVVTGKIESVIPSGIDSTRTYQINGYGCNFNKATKIQVKLQVRPNPTTVLTLQTGTANLSPDAANSFACGTGATGFRFQFQVPTSTVQAQLGQRIYVEGQSAVSGQTNALLVGSGIQRFTSGIIYPIPDKKAN